MFMQKLLSSPFLESQQKATLLASVQSRLEELHLSALPVYIRFLEVCIHGPAYVAEHSRHKTPPGQQVVNRFNSGSPVLNHQPRQFGSANYYQPSPYYGTPPQLSSPAQFNSPPMFHMRFSSPPLPPQHFYNPHMVHPGAYNQSPM